MSEKRSNGPEAVIHPGPGSQMVELMAPSDLLMISKAEIDLQISTAKQFPRCLKDFQASAEAMVTYSQEIAETMFYKLPRGGKVIEGPSVRFAEIIGQNWRNCRVGARVLGTDEKHVTSQGVFHDLETNVAISFEIKRRITKRDGTRYDDDMIGTTGAAAAGIAFRNAVLKGVPKMFWAPLYDQALKAALPKDRDVAARRKDALEYFRKMEVPEAAILETLGVKTLAKIGAEELVTLKGIANAIKEGSTTVKEAFGLGPKPLEPTMEQQLEESIEDVNRRKAQVAGKNRRVETRAAKSSPNNPQNSEASGPPRAAIRKVEDPYLTSKQQSDIFNIAVQSGWKVPEELTQYIQKTFKVKSIREVRQSQFAELMKTARGDK